MNNKIGVIGIGRLGLSFALLAESCGYEVMGNDKRAEYTWALNRNEFTTPEPQIGYLLQRSKNFSATSDIDRVLKFADLLFVFVPTPSKENGEYNHEHIEEVVSDLLKFGEENNIKGKTLVIGCTTMPMYCKTLHERLIPYGVNVIYNAEFIAQGSIVNDLVNADFVLIGCDENCPLSEVKNVYRTIMKEEPEFKILSHTAAEITKIGINCFLTTKISFANMIAEIAINSGEESMVRGILNTIGSDQRIGNKYLNYGFGYSGVCLPRDNRALGIHSSKVWVPPLIPEATDEFNTHHLMFLKQKLMEDNPDKNNKFIFNQLSYKRGIDIITESQHYQLCKMLLDEGYKVNIVESETIMELVKPELAQYGDNVTYGQNGASNHPERMVEGQKKHGYVIEL